MENRGRKHGSALGWFLLFVVLGIGGFVAIAGALGGLDTVWPSWRERFFQEKEAIDSGIVISAVILGQGKDRQSFLTMKDFVDELYFTGDSDYGDVRLWHWRTVVPISLAVQADWVTYLDANFVSGNGFAIVKPAEAEKGAVRIEFLLEFKNNDIVTMMRMLSQPEAKGPILLNGTLRNGISVYSGSAMFLMTVESWVK